MIHIDDAGSGSLLGGTCIGIMRVETGEYYYDIVPLEFYRPDNFKQKKYQEYVTDIVSETLSKAGVDRLEPIRVCRGYMFDKLKKWLDEKGYSWENSKILDPLQTVVEKTFEGYAVSLGLPPRYISYTKYPFHFHRLLKWVYADYDSRNGLCKSGWNSWRKYGNLKREVYRERMPRPHLYCLKCGENIPAGSDVKVVKYITNRVNRVYLHEHC